MKGKHSNGLVKAVIQNDNGLKGVGKTGTGTGTWDWDTEGKTGTGHGTGTLRVNGDGT